MGEFHAWIYDKQEKRIIDYDTTEPELIQSYLDSINERLFSRKYTINDVRGFSHLEKKPHKLIKRAIARLKREYKKTPRNIDDYKTYEGDCLRRAVITYLSNPKRFKICIGSLSIIINGTPYKLWDYIERDDF